MLLLAIALALAQGAQAAQAAPSSGSAPVVNDSAPANGSAPAADLHLLDEVVQIVNENMLTSRTFIRAMVWENKGKSFASEEEQLRNQQKVQKNTVQSALRIQAGQDMGLDPAQVDREAKNWIEQQRQREGQDAFAAKLRNSGMTLFEYQEFIRDRLYSEFWENHVTGSGPVGQGERQSRDRYVRPGQVLFRYRQCVEHPELLPLVGGRDQAVIVQQLIIDPATSGGPEASRNQLRDLRRRIVDGEDMSELVDRYAGYKVNHGVTEPYAESRIIKVDPALGAFVAESKPGDLSDVQEYTVNGKARMRIVRLVDRLPPLVPEISSLEVQKRLEKGMRTDLAEWRKDQAYKVLYRSSYVWSPNTEEPAR